MTQTFTLSNKTTPAFAEVVVGSAQISVFIHQDSHTCTGHYILDLEHRKALESYSSVHALAKYANKNQKISDNADKDTCFIGFSLYGSEFQDNEIIEIGIIDSNEQVLFHSLYSHSPFVSPLGRSGKLHHNIEMEDTIKAPFIVEHWAEIKSIIKDKEIVVLNKQRAETAAVVTYKNLFSIVDDKREFEELFPDYSVKGIDGLINKDRKREAHILSATLEWASNTEQEVHGLILYDDVLGRRAIANCIKTARLWRKINEQHTALDMPAH